MDMISIMLERKGKKVFYSIIIITFINDDVFITFL